VARLLKDTRVYAKMISLTAQSSMQGLSVLDKLTPDGCCEGGSPHKISVRAGLSHSLFLLSVLPSFEYVSRTPVEHD